MASDYIPGSASLGFGFDVYGRYSETSKTRPLFNMVFGSKTFGKYLVPENAQVEGTRRNYGNSTYVDSRKKMEEHFSSKLTVKAKYGFFSGQFDASYSSSNKSDVSYQFGIMETYSQQYYIELIDRSESALASWVKDDADYKNMPDTFNDSNRLLFFRFFDKYGIYYMPRVIVGSRLYYTSSVAKEYEYTSTEAEAKLKLEYKAIFGASAEAQASWKAVGESWATRREVKIETIGGSSEMLNILVPGYGANHETAYNAWLESAAANPVVIDFELSSIAEIFSGSKAEAVKTAIEAYLLHKLFLESKTGSCLIAFNGKPVVPQPTGEGRALGYQLAAISRQDLKLKFARSYTTGDMWDNEKLYTQMMDNIKEFNTPDHIIAFVAFSNFAQNAPPKFFVEFLMRCGAGTALAQWIDTRESNQGIYSCCTLAHCNYVFAGIPGSERGSGHEMFERAGSCDTAQAHWAYYDQWLDKPAPMASLIIDLYLVEGKNGEALEANMGRAR